MADTVSISTIGPRHHGQRMSLEEFARVTGEPGHIYELEKGVILVVDVPGVPHMLVKQALRNRLALYQAAHPPAIFAIADGSDCAVRMTETQSERHPDLAVYLTPPPVTDDQPWDFWTPDLVVEVVSKSSAQRDYVTKADEYLRAGVRLYWIIDPQTRAATILTRQGDAWRTERLDVTGMLQTPLLPGFELALAEVFRAGA